ncbi:MAG: phosphoserine phosphatase SerB [Betaproteobacteria bacterium]
MTPYDFVVQAPQLSPASLAALARLARADAIIPFGSGTPPAFRFPGLEPDTTLLSTAIAMGCDAAFVPRDRRLADVRLVAMDMDSTLITIECIDEIADMQGIKPEVAAITASAMRGEIEFAESLRRRVALLAGLPVAALAQVYDERLRLSSGAERMLAGFMAVGAKTALLSGGFTFFTDRLMARLKLDHAASNTLEVVGGKLTGHIEGVLVDPEAKAAELRRLKARLCGDSGLAIVLGDGANDLPMFAAADISIAYRAKPVVRAKATHALDHCGLDGALNLFT